MLFEAPTAKLSRLALITLNPLRNDLGRLLVSILLHPAKFSNNTIKSESKTEFRALLSEMAFTTVSTYRLSPGNGINFLDLFLDLGRSQVLVETRCLTS